MNRRILFQVTAPAVLIGAVLLGTCGSSAWYITRLQTSISNVLADNVASLEAAEELEIRVRQLRFHTLLNLSDPGPLRQQRIQRDQRLFEDGLQRARESASTDEERECVRLIDDEYRRYKKELASLETNESGTTSPIGRLSDAHPVERVVNPCQELLDLNKEAIQRTAQESQRVSTEARQAMVLAGLAGPIGGVIIGYGIARGLSRSIYQLSVRVHDMAQHLDQDVASVSVATSGDIGYLDKQLQHVLGRVQEMTERVQQQQREILRAEQLSAVGQLGASVAHEVRNPLTGIKMLVDAALRPTNPQPLSREDLEVIRSEITRMEKTVQGLLDFARPPAIERCSIRLQETVGQAVDLVRARARQQDVGIQVHAPLDGILVFADRSQLHTVLINLLLNALDAMPQGGILQIDLSTLSEQEARLDVGDTGSGISTEMAGKLFTPFASGKPTGTGLGLSISKRIVDEHGGRIMAANRPEGGACFSIVLPASLESERATGTLEVPRSSQAVTS